MVSKHGNEEIVDKVGAERDKGKIRKFSDVGKNEEMFNNNDIMTITVVNRRERNT